MRTYFRVHPGDQDPESLLDPEQHRCEPWGGSEAGQPCDKCGGTGETDFRCESCLATEPDPDCPACGGRVAWRDRCPVCLGDGIIDDATRYGVSVFPRLEGLLRYMDRRGSDIDGDVVVELEGELTHEVDFDADEGALLVVPTRIVKALPAEAVGR
ncbi:MAG TPA: hypothetical protein VFR97_11175 [Capillimicrobium sp.]|nr:hypothetical protein [Capillimicrobium sp.]